MDALPRDRPRERGKDALPRVRHRSVAKPFQSQTSLVRLQSSATKRFEDAGDAEHARERIPNMSRNSPLKRTNNRENNPERLCYGMDIVDTKYRSAAQCASHDARDRSGISIRRVGNSEDVTDHGLAGNRK